MRIMPCEDPSDILSIDTAVVIFKTKHLYYCHHSLKAEIYALLIQNVAYWKIITKSPLLQNAIL